MKIGLILECSKDGPDKTVYEHIVKMLLPDVAEIRSSTLVNKNILKEACGLNAKVLLDTGYDPVVIIWDLWPAWREGLPSREEDQKDILKSLNAAGVRPEQVNLVCVVEEMDAWMLADERAIKVVLEGLSSHRVGTISVPNRPEKVHRPKDVLSRIFQAQKRPSYNDYVHAPKIAKSLVDLKRLKRRCPIFKEFVRVVTAADEDS